MSSLTSKLEDALRVLVITGIVDQRIRDPELDEFCEQAIGIAPLCGEQGFDTEKALEWYAANQAEILEKLESRSRNTTILKSITCVKDEVIREALYDSMLAISISDDEYHRKESDLVRSSAAIWGYVRPPFKVVDPESDDKTS